MGKLKDLENKISEYMSGDYEIVETKNIPSVENVGFGKKAFKTRVTSLCIDLRRSTDLLMIHNKQTCGKIHKSFLTIATEIVLNNGGQIRSFNGDSLLAFWPANFQSEIAAAVQAAFQIKWALDVKFSPYFEQYSKLDFGIGIDWGEVFIVRTGLSRNDNNNDLVFLGMCVNFATAIASQAKGPYHIEISESTYSNLPEQWISGNNNGVRMNMWINTQAEWKSKKWTTKGTSWHQPMAE